MRSLNLVWSLLFTGAACAGVANAQVAPNSIAEGSYVWIWGRYATATGATITVQRDPGNVPYEWMQNFRLFTDSGRGVFGLRDAADPGGRMLVFSIADAAVFEPGPGTTRVGNTLLHPYRWRQGVPYTFHMQKGGSNSLWRLTVSAPGIAPIDVGGIGYGGSYMLTQAFSNVAYRGALSECAALPYARAEFANVYFVFIDRFGARAIGGGTVGPCGANAQVSVNDDPNGTSFRTGMLRSIDASLRSDFDGGGRSDILWRNNATGANTIWLAGNSLRQVEMPRTAITWQIAGIGDFNDDGRFDILWRNTISGANTIWRSGMASTAERIAPLTDHAWRVAGIGDFNNDASADILWRNGDTGENAIWLSGRNTYKQPVNTLIDRAWKVTGIGDFDGDGRSDILWRNSATGANTIWRTADSTNRQSVATISNLSWAVAGIGDFNGDGRSDVLWTNRVTRANFIWQSAQASRQQPVTSAAANWHVAAIGDFNGDRSSDILWRNAVTGANVIWKSANSAAVQAVTGVSNQDWSVANSN